MYGQRARERNVIATRRGGERERGVSSGKDGLYAMHKTEQGFATYKGKSVIVSTMIYDPPCADFCASRCSSPREARPRGTSIGRKFPQARYIDNIFHGTRLYYFLTPLLPSIIISMHYSSCYYLIGSIGTLDNSITARITRS